MEIENLKNRKGATKIALIPKEVLDLINQGTLATVNLVEWLAVDHLVLVKNILPSLTIVDCYQEIVWQSDLLKKATAMQMTKLVAQEIFKACNNASVLTNTIQKLSTHRSDTLRGYACYLIAYQKNLTLSQQLEMITPLAADEHFGVREIAWMAMRPTIAENLEESVSLLIPFVINPNEYLRRFATEITRPRGVWCQHLEVLKDNPSKALPLLAPLYNDPSRYVQNSVANWLNDASKSDPNFVETLCKQWEQKSATKETSYIVKSALRSILKK
jgi:3-methyladenine DNA glycosylase AlkC